MPNKVTFLFFFVFLRMAILPLKEPLPVQIWVMLSASGTRGVAELRVS
jgi:hypothetical protein